jgi:hypothetical protein
MMTFLEKIGRLRARASAGHARLPHPYPPVVLFLSVSDGAARAHVVHAAAGTFEEAWELLVARAEALLRQRRLIGRWLRVDWVSEARATTWSKLGAQLATVKRNYFRRGLALDAAFETAFLEQELNGNAMLYGGNAIGHAVLNRKNFLIYAQRRCGADVEIDFSPTRVVHSFRTAGLFCDEDGHVHDLDATKLSRGRRRIDSLSRDDVHSLVAAGSGFLARQVGSEGRFVYGWHPCFDREIGTYNTLRHASTTYAMIEAWQLTGDALLKDAIERSLAYLVENLIQHVVLPDGTEAAFLVDVGNEIKLGGNAVAILAMCKYGQVTKSDRFLPLAQKLAIGIGAMQRQDTGGFVHVLNFPDLTTKAVFRTVYYDGEAAFALMRLYSLTRDPRWIGIVERAFDYFIAQDHWRHHDHWLSYCVNELTRYRSEERYFRFGIRNVAGYLDFVRERITTFPTLLELMMAAREMLSRLAAIPELQHLLDLVDLEKFEEALEYRAHYLLNGHFWPEIAMFFRNPQRILGSFFIRHHAFRVRIDDVEHYLSGLVAYRAYLEERPAFRAIVERQRLRRRAGAEGPPAGDAAPHWTAASVAAAH